MNILGISYFMHESASCLVQDGKLVFACAEERLSRKKQDGSFPVLSIQASLDHAGLKLSDIDHVALGWSKAGMSARHDLRLLLAGKLPRSWNRLEKTLIQWTKEWRHGGGKVDLERAFGKLLCPFHFVDHHLAHALSAACLSGFQESAVLVIDGRGAHEATTLWHWQDGKIRLLEEYSFPNSLGVFYAGITEVLGFQPLSDEWKVMGLASYGEPSVDLSPLINVTDEGYEVSVKSFFGGPRGNSIDIESVTGPKRKTDEITQHHKNVARSAQDKCEQAMLAVLRRAMKLTGSKRLCMAGGVALNCKANGELLRSGLIDDIYVQPAAGDDGACIGAAFAIYQRLGLTIPSHVVGHSYLGTSHSNDEIEQALQVYKLNYRRTNDATKVAARLLAANHLVGWFQGRMEFGPRALGARSILSDPRYSENRDRVNEAVKFRENWRPFAPSVLAEKGHLYFKDFRPSPYMILSFWATDEGKTRLPAVVHVDGSCRVQTVTRDTNPKYHDMLLEFERLTGVGACMNTSFNLKGDAIVESPKDAVQTFYSSGLDYLVIGDFVVTKGREISAEVERLLV